MKQGFTLVELLVVVLIIGILAAMAMPHYEKAVWESRASQLFVSVRSLANAQENFFLKTGHYAKTFQGLSYDFNNMQSVGQSEIGLTTPSSDAVRYKDLFELVINLRGDSQASFSFSSGFFIKGRYKGGGIMFVHREGLGNLHKKMYCAEVISKVTKAGDFCKDVMTCEGTPISQNGVRFYELP